MYIYIYMYIHIYTCVYPHRLAVAVVSGHSLLQRRLQYTYAHTE